MHTQTQPTTKDLGHVLLEIATTRAMARNANHDPLQGRYLDTGLTPGELYDLCLTQLAQGAGDDPAEEAWAPLVVRALDRTLHEGLFRFHVRVQEALGRVRVFDDDDSGEAHVFVTAEVLAATAGTAA